MKSRFVDTDSRQYRRSRRLVTVIAIAACFLFGTVAYAAGGYVAGWFSEPVEKFEDVRIAESKLEQKLGYAPVFIDSFENGYSFSSGHVDNNQIVDGELGPVENFLSAQLIYEKDGDIVYFDQLKSESMDVKMGEPVAEYEGVQLYHSSFVNMVAPVDYQPADEELAAEERGELMINYGSDSVVKMKITSIQWHVDGVNYQLMQMDGRLSADELIEMAKGIIET